MAHRIKTALRTQDWADKITQLFRAEFAEDDAQRLFKLTMLFTERPLGASHVEQGAALTPRIGVVRLVVFN